MLHTLQFHANIPVNRGARSPIIILTCMFAQLLERTKIKDACQSNLWVRTVAALNASSPNCKKSRSKSLRVQMCCLTTSRKEHLHPVMFAVAPRTTCTQQTQHCCSPFLSCTSQDSRFAPHCSCWLQPFSMMLAARNELMIEDPSFITIPWFPLSLSLSLPSLSLSIYIVPSTTTTMGPWIFTLTPKPWA